MFIDACHSKRAVLRDAKGVMRVIQDGAYILFHDACRQDVKEAIDAFANINMSRIVDFGLLTREYTQGEDREEKDCEKISCGFRLVQLRRRHGLLRPINRLRGVYAQFSSAMS